MLVAFFVNLIRFRNQASLVFVVKIDHHIMTMKRVLIILSVSIICITIIGLMVLNFWIRRDVKANIELAQEKYSGTPEEALIAFLKDENNTTIDRTHIAIWTLGQIESEKALPILQDYYKNDPKGETCFERHDIMICQYEIYKAIQTIENGKLISYRRLKKD